MADEMTFQVKVDPPSVGRRLPLIEVYHLVGGALLHSHLVLPAPPEELFTDTRPYYELFASYEQQLSRLGISQPTARFEEVTGLAEVERMLRDLMRLPVHSQLDEAQVRVHIDGLITTMMEIIHHNLGIEDDAPGQYL